MTIGQRVCEIRQAKGLTQRALAQRTGLYNCYVSRVENGYVIPQVSTLEVIACGLEVPLYYLFYQGDALPPDPPDEAKPAWEASVRITKLRLWLSRMSERDRDLLMVLARKLAARRRRK